MKFKDKLIKELKEHKNEMVLYHYEVHKLISIVDGKDDYYYVFQNTSGDIRYVSCVIGYIKLKGKIDNDDYTYIARSRNIKEMNKGLKKFKLDLARDLFTILK